MTKFVTRFSLLEVVRDELAVPPSWSSILHMQDFMAPCARTRLTSFISVRLLLLGVAATPKCYVSTLGIALLGFCASIAGLVAVGRSGRGSAPCTMRTRNCILPMLGEPHAPFAALLSSAVLCYVSSCSGSVSFYRAGASHQPAALMLKIRAQNVPWSPRQPSCSDVLAMRTP